MSKSSPENTEPPTRQFQSISANPPFPPLIHTLTNGSRLSRHNTATSPLDRAPSRLSRKATFDPQLDINLPYRTFSDNANLDEYTTEKVNGEIDGQLGSDGKPKYE